MFFYARFHINVSNTSNKGGLDNRASGAQIHPGKESGHGIIKQRQAIGERRVDYSLKVVVDFISI